MTTETEWRPAPAGFLKHYPHVFYLGQYATQFICYCDECTHFHAKQCTCACCPDQARYPVVRLLGGETVNFEVARGSVPKDRLAQELANLEL